MTKILTNINYKVSKISQQYVFHPVRMVGGVCCLAFVFVVMSLMATFVNAEGKEATTTFAHLLVLFLLSLTLSTQIHLCMEINITCIPSSAMLLADIHTPVYLLPVIISLFIYAGVINPVGRSVYKQNSYSSDSDMIH